MTLPTDGESVTKEEGAQAPESTGFDEAWDEIDATETASDVSDPPADEAAGKDKDPVDGDEHPDGEVDTQPDSSAEPGQNKEAAGAQSDPPASQASDDDIWSGVSPEARARLEAVLRDKDYKLDSVKGRLSVLDRQLEQYRGGGQGQSQGEGGKSKTSVRELLESDDFKKARDEYGEQLAPLFNVVDTLTDRLEAMGGTVEAVEESRTADFLTSQLALYAKDHPDWESYTEDKRFGPWLQQQPEEVQAMVAKNREYIVDAAAASRALTMFKMDHGIALRPGAQTQEPPKQPEEPASDRRDRQRDSARSTSAGGGPVVTTGIPDGFDDAWDAYEELDQRRERQRK